EELLFLADGHFDTDDLVTELTSADCRHRPTIGLRRVAVLIGARNLALSRAQLGALAHVPVAVHVPKPVVDHRIDQLAVAEPVALACPVEQIWHTAHVFHPARDHQRRIAGLQHLRAEHYRLEPAAANPVDLGRTHALRQAGEDRRLARRGLT